MATPQQRQDEDLAGDTRSAMRAASERISRDRSKTQFLQRAAKMVIDYVGSGKKLDQLSNLKNLAGVSLVGESCNLSDLNAALRDASWSVIRDYLEQAHPRHGNQTMAEYETDRKVCALLKNAMAIGGDEGGLRRVKDAIRKLDSEEAPEG